LIDNGRVVRNFDNNLVERKIQKTKIIKEEKKILKIEYKPLILEDENECQCCFDKVKKENTITCTGANEKYRHMFCGDCIKGYIDSVLDQNKHIGCMMSAQGCNGYYKDNDMKKVLDEEKYKRYLESAHVGEVMMLTKNLDNYQTCPFCTKYGIIIENIDQIPNDRCYIDCPHCKKSWCIKCRNEKHIPDPCGKLKTTDEKIIKNIVTQTIDDALIHKCPKCMTKYEKVDGCNLITCSTCHTYSCYLCGLLIVPKNGQKYWHFGSGYGLCPLYNSNDSDVKKGNIKYNTEKIKTKLNDLITINKDNEDVVNKLKEECKRHGYEVDTKKTYSIMDYVNYLIDYLMNYGKKLKPEDNSKIVQLLDHYSGMLPNK